MFLLGLGGCGYKADPYYESDTNMNDNNVKFIVTDTNNSRELK